MDNFPILSITILLPLISAIYMMIFVKQSLKPAKLLYAKYVAILSSILTLVAAIFIVVNFDPNEGYQYLETNKFIKSIGLDLSFGLDGISLFFVFLTALLTVICIIISLYSINKNIKEFLCCFLLLESFAIGVFCSTNLLLFYIFFEAILIPMYIIIGMWGGNNRIYATLKFFLYTLFGSVLFLIDIIYLYNKFGTLSLIDLASLSDKLSYNEQYYLWIAAFIAFAVKVPMFPLHTWLPDAHVEAPTAGSVILAGILLKVGAYGFIRVSLPIFPLASVEFAPFMLVLSVIAIIYASLVAIAQTDMKKTIAYSSVAHMGFVTGGIFSFNSEGMSGAIMQMISHGIVSSGLFIVVGFLYERAHTKDISAFGGVANRMPFLATFFMILTLSSVGLPGTSGFVGEVLAIVGMYKVGFVYAAFAALSMILGAIYMLRLYRNIMLGMVKNSIVEKFEDINAREIVALAPLVILTLLLGLYPHSVTKYYNREAANLVKKITGEFNGSYMQIGTNSYATSKNIVSVIK